MPSALGMTAWPAGAWCAAVIVLAGSFGCPSASFVEHGPESRDGLAVPGEPYGWPRPLLDVDPPGLFDDEALRAEVVAQRRDGGATEVELAIVRGGDAAPERARLRHHLGAGLSLPLVTGQRYWLRTSVRRTGQGLLVWDEAATPRLLAAVSIDEGLASDAVAGLDVALAQGDGVVFTDVRTAPSGCTTALDHYALTVRAGGDERRLLPGGALQIGLAGQRFDVHALDASRPNARLAGAEDTRCPSGAHVSWVALAARPEP